MREKVIDLEDRDRGPVCKYVNTPKEETKAQGQKSDFKNITEGKTCSCVEKIKHTD